MIHIISKLLTLCVAVSGFLFQVHSISVSYFEFKTSTRTSETLPDQYPPQNLVLCFPFEELISPSHDVSRHTGALSIEETFNRERDLPNLTISEIFDRTPQVDDKLFRHCMMRNAESFNSVSGGGALCTEQLFAVSKFFSQESICYHIKPRVLRNYSYSRISHSLTLGGFMYGVGLDVDAFHDVSRVKIILHEGRGLPHLSRKCAFELRRHLEPPMMHMQNERFVVITASTTKIIKLPPPYETQCNPNERYTEACRRRCSITTIASELSKVPFSFILDDSKYSMNADYLNYTFINLSDLKNETVSRRLFETEELCDLECFTKSCLYSYSTTDVMDSDELAVFNLMFAAFATRTAYVVVPFFPKLVLSEFLVYVGSCSCLWFGFSVITVDRFQWIREISFAINRLMRRRAVRIQTDNHSINVCKSKFYVRRKSARVRVHTPQWIIVMNPERV